MKKILFSMLAVAAIASCAKTEPTYVEADSEIKLNPVTTVATKANQLAAITTAEYPQKEAFDVYAYWLDDAGEVMDTPYLTGENSGVEFVNKGTYWGGKTTYYWPKNGSLRFAAYSPSSLDMTHSYAEDTYELEDFAYPAADATEANYTSKTYDILVAKTSEPYTAETGASKVSVKFEHALSWLTFKLQSTEVANEAFTVTKVVVNGVAKKGTLTANMAADTKTWDLSDGTSAIDVFSPKKEDYYTVTPTAVVKENNENGLLVLPQTPTDVTVYYTQNALKDENGNVTSPSLSDQKITVSLVLDDENDTWEPGKRYTYTILFDLDEILINPTVEDWEETTEVIVNSDPVKVSSSAELVAAISEGKDVVLADDITVDGSVIVEPVAVKSAATHEVTIDLNGYDITAGLPYQSGMTGEQISAITVRGGASLTIVGNGTVAGTTYGVYAKEGTVTIKGGSYVAGTSAVQVYNATANIEGGYFYNTANDKRYVINCIDAAYKNGPAVVNITGGTFKDFNPADNAAEGPGTNFVAEGYGSYELEKGVWTVASKTEPVSVANETALTSVLAQGGVAVLVDDINLTDLVQTSKTANTTVTIDLNGHDIRLAETGTRPQRYAIYANAGTILTIKGSGTIDAYQTPVWVNGATVYLEGGNYVGGYDGSATIYAYTGNVCISGGTYEAKVESSGMKQYSVLNCEDSGYKNGKTTMSVKGGNFKNFDPSNNKSEGKGTDFVPAGYKVLVDGDWYTVVAE